MSDAKGQDRNVKIGLNRQPGAGRGDVKVNLEQGVVRQSFSHGRSKQVAVEVKQPRRRTPAPAAPTTPGKPAAGGRGGAGSSPRAVAAARAALQAERAAQAAAEAQAAQKAKEAEQAAELAASRQAAEAEAKAQAPAAQAAEAAATPAPVEAKAEATAPAAEAPAQPAPAAAPPVPEVVAEAAQEAPAAERQAPAAAPEAEAPAQPVASKAADPAPAPKAAAVAPAQPAANGAGAAAPARLARPRAEATAAGRQPAPRQAGAGTPAAPSRGAGTAGRAGTAQRGAANRSGGRGPMVLKPLTDEEKRSRLKALSAARRVEEDARKRAEENARRATDEAARRRADEEAAAARKAEEDARRRTEEDARRKAEEVAAKLLAEEEARRARGDEAAAPEAEGKASPKRLAKQQALQGREVEDEGKGKARGKAGEKRGAPGAGARKDARRGRLTLGDEDSDNRRRSMASIKRQRDRDRQAAQANAERQVREVVIPEIISVQDLAARMAVRGADVVKALMGNGVMATINQEIDAETAELVVTEFGHTPKLVSEADVEIGLEGSDDDAGDLQPRPPVVTVMGHVDHGKTSLLDALRKADVAAGEAGGITQHIGAYRVDTGQGVPVTFIDTPGHAAFTQMRARGASITDVVVLVVAADDGVMPQTIEAISHAKAANVPMIVAVNKIDRPDSDPGRVKQELLSHDVVVEDFGGDVLVVEVSAVKKTNLDKLIEALQLQSELLDLKANPNREATGAVIEARLDKGRGVVATVLVQNGTLKQGDIVVAGAQWGRARALTDDRGRPAKEAGPAVPVEILGLDGVPDAGDQMVVVDSERRAREITDYRLRKRKGFGQVASAGGVSLEDMFSQLKSGALGELPVVIKSDVHGSLEAISQGLEKLSTDEVKVRVVHGGVGAITESDVTLANASKAVIVGFNVRANVQARDAAKQNGIEIRYYSIIYELLDDMKGLLSGMLAPESREEILGHAEIREVFSVPKIGKVAGCMVVDGTIRRQARCRLLRDNVVIFEGELSSLRRFKDDVREVREGFECGIGIANYNDIQQGDVIEAFEIQEVARSL